MLIPDYMRRIADRLNAGRRVNRITVRDFLGIFGAERRGSIKVQEIQEVLDALNLTTVPNFELAWIDEPIWLKLKDGAKAKVASDIIIDEMAEDAEFEGTATPLTPTPDLAEPPLTSAAPDTPTRSEIPDGISGEDPTFRIGSLPAANKTLITISNDAPLTRAITLMLQYDFSQLPVMQGEREVKGVITWKSIGLKLAMGQKCSSVGDCREEIRIIDSNRTLFEAIPTIVEFGYTLVRDQQNRRITGIITASDLSLQFQTLSEPFLLLREIELHIRRILGTKVTASDFQILEAAAPANRKVSQIEELTLGQYIRLLQHPDVWTKLALSIDATEFVQLLDQVRKIRNEVMHFDRDPMTKDQLDTLKRTARFMQHLYEYIPSR
ncbi:CBS domain-containing protein [Bradyrhizobium japonicum]|uniref:CBS domain-containing protein n=1 Tax=Bradyrhizobium japonicum TaxID=375 RepID=UPI001B8A5F9A|nr:CBS domain-containing protein [Bradyrhizobium japonicum]MBR0972788.1 CBS domain-containing protein [Bradyrhizobium japonicum]